MDDRAAAVRIEKQKRVTTVILSRPNVRNAVDSRTAVELADAMRAVDADESAAACVLFGDHGTFCSGADLRAIEAGAGNRLSPDGDSPLGPARMILSKPVVAAISGHAVAGGLELALWCDLRVMEEDAIAGVFSRRFGIPLIDGGTVRLPRLIGLSRALDLILTGRSVGADEALAIGLVNRVVPKGTARRAAESLAAEIASFPQAALLADRSSAYQQFGLDWNDAMRAEFARGVATFDDAEVREQIRRFLTRGER